MIWWWFICAFGIRSSSCCLLKAWQNYVHCVLIITRRIVMTQQKLVRVVWNFRRMENRANQWDYEMVILTDMYKMLPSILWTFTLQRWFWQPNSPNLIANKAQWLASWGCSQWRAWIRPSWWSTDQTFATLQPGDVMDWTNTGVIYTQLQYMLHMWLLTRL